jgi:hypothetical protein
MTIPEFLEMLDGRNRREEIEMEKMKVQAWQNASLIRCSIASVFSKDVKFPELQDILKNKEPQTAEQMEAALCSINAAFGGNVIYYE